MSVRELQKSERADIQMDADTTAKAVESIVLRGDISGMQPAEKARYYVQLCSSLGLSPASQPFAILRLNGKEICYPTRGATDQLAAIHRLTREITDGPKVIDLAGTKLVYAVCRATHPNGRTETSVATVKLADPENALMKAETKAKRRATLSILGLGMLDETEIEAIPAIAKSPASPIVLQKQSGATSVETRTETPEALLRFYAHIEDIELPGECVAAWIRYRNELAKLPKTDAEAAWNALIQRCQDVGKMKNAKAWLKRGIAEEDIRMGAPEPDGFFDNATSESAQPTVASEIDALKTEDVPALDALREDINAIEEDTTTLLAAARVWRKHNQAVYAEAAGDAEHLFKAQQLVLGATKVGCTRNQLNEHVAALEMRDKTSPDGTYADVIDLLELAESANEVVEAWKTNRAAIDLRSEEIRTLLRKVATRRVQELMPGMADAKQAAQWLKNALAPKDPPKPPNGGGPKPEASVTSEAEDPERESIAAEGNGAATMVVNTEEVERLRVYLWTIDHKDHLANAIAKHETEYQLPQDIVTREAIERGKSIGLTAQQTVNALTIARKHRKANAA